MSILKPKPQGHVSKGNIFLSMAALVLVLVFILLATWLCTGARPPQPSPGLTFLGYTNTSVVSVAALVMLTNNSDVPLEIVSKVRAAHVLEIDGEFSIVPGLVTVRPKALPRLLQPGETTVLPIDLYSGFQVPWWTEVATRPRLRTSFLRDYAAGIRQPPLRRWAQRLYPPVETSFTELGPFTNLPSGWYRASDGSAHRHLRESAY